MANKIKIAGTTSNTFQIGLKGVTINSSPVATPYQLNLPSTVGNNTQVLSTDGTGNLAWVTQSGAIASGSNTQIQFNTNGIFGASANLTFNSETALLSVSGNISANNLNGTITTPIQPNITSLGTLGNLSVSGNITAQTGIFTNVSGNGTGLTNLNAGNIVGQVANALVAGTVYSPSQPNITSLGTLGNLSVSGNANVGNLNISGNIVDSGALTISTGSSGNITLSPNGTGITIVNSALTAVGNVQSNNVVATTAILRNNRNVPTYVAQALAPTQPLLGDQWYDIDTGILYQYQNDGSVSYWQDMSTNIGVLPNLSVSGNVVATSINVNNTFGFKNKIINGDMRIDQRNNGNVSVSSTAGVYTIDRFAAQSSGTTTHTISKSTIAPPGFINSLLTTVNTANSSPTPSAYFTTARQAIEGRHIVDLAWGTSSAKTIAVSFWVRCSVTGTYPFFIQNGITPRRSYVSSYTVNTINTWEYKTIIIPGDTTGAWDNDANIGIGVGFDLGSGSNYYAPSLNTWNQGTYLTTASLSRLMATANATLYITGLQLEVGNMATSFDYRDFGRELIMCQRYFQVLQCGVGTCQMAAAAIARLTWPLKVSMRSAPSIGAFNTPQFFNGFTTLFHSGFGPNYSTTEVAQIDNVITTVNSNGGYAAMQVVSNAYYYIASSEL